MRRWNGPYSMAKPDHTGWYDQWWKSSYLNRGEEVPARDAMTANEDPAKLLKMKE